MKNSESNVPAIFYLIMIIAALVIIVAGMMHARVILLPLMMAIFLAISCSGPMAWFQEKGLPQWLALFLVLALVCCFAISVVLITGASMKDFIHNIPEYESKLHQQTEQLYSFLGSKGVHLKGKGMEDILNPALAMKYAGLVLNGLGNLLANGFVILLIVIFLLFEADGFPVKLKAIYGDDDRKQLQLQKFKKSVKEYLLIKTLVSLTTGVLATLALLLIGVDYPIMWGMLAFAFNFVPTIGSIIAAVPPALLAMVQLGPGSAVTVAVCYLTINLLMGNVVEPRFMGKGLGLSTLVVFLSLLFWGWVLGPVGMLLSVILTMKLKIMLDSNEDTQWLGLLLGPSPAGEKQTIILPTLRN